MLLSSIEKSDAFKLYILKFSSWDWERGHPVKKFEMWGQNRNEYATIATSITVAGDRYCRVFAAECNAVQIFALSCTCTCSWKHKECVPTLTQLIAWYMTTRRNIRVLSSSGASIQSNSPLLDCCPPLLPVPSSRFGIWGQNRRRGRLTAKRTGAAKVLSSMRRPAMIPLWNY